MEKIIKTLPELKSIIDANKFHTFDYTEGLSVSDGIEIFEIDIEETDDYQGASATLCIYPNEDILFNDIKSNIKSMDLEEGADDQYYDYSPSQVETIIYAIPQLTLEHQDYTIEDLKTHLRNFIANEENDEDLEEDITIITTNGGQEVNLILNTDDLILFASIPRKKQRKNPSYPSH